MAWRKTEVAENEDQLEVADIDSLPFPAYDLIDSR